jgi:hypothetical protein
MAKNAKNAGISGRSGFFMAISKATERAQYGGLKDPILIICNASPSSQ